MLIDTHSHLDFPDFATERDAVIARAPAKAERAILVLIDGAGEDIEAVLSSRRKLPSLALPAPRLKARPPAPATSTR
mgnify:CR=1 FL=1